jgi:hypothetical protein
VTGQEIVAQNDGSQARQPRVIALERAFDRIALGIVFLGAFLASDELGHLGHSL